MLPVKISEKKWKIDVRLGGRGSRRIRKTFPTKAEALAYLSHVQAGKKDPSFMVSDRRRCSELVELWYLSHGRTLRDGLRRRDWLLRLVVLAGDPLGTNFSPAVYTALRALRANDVSANTLNRDLAYLRAMFSTLYKLGLTSYPSPLSRVSQLPHRATELSYLTSLLDALRHRPDAYAIASICLATGARWSEAQNLTPAAVEPTRLRFYGKNGKFRYVPISEGTFALIAPFLRGHPTQRIFKNSYEVFRHAVDRAGIHLPPGQLSHVLRHTFATCFLSAGGDLRTLQRVLDHGDIRMTLRYAHAIPDHLSQVLTCNPLDGGQSVDT